MSSSVEPFPTCPNTSSVRTDIAWLLHRAAQRIRQEWDVAAREHGLRDMRDWIVLAAVGEGEKRTQLAIGQELGLDKTTLMSVLDRLERDGFVVRTVDPNDRRARVPELTEIGAKVRDLKVPARQRVEEAALTGASTEDRHVFFSVLSQLAGVDSDSEEPSHGSCMR
ncbi:MarR family winged helix-turn-helix transcriptional regulator [Stackebrandtia nassauensis]|uniref:Transcriptional regulator, MarR family n=1 Tax=Stackebrandtia nassauensis (strain DSM 44728 / CIP 108903 / NRRL B-16338 / NBRC 102104 / LLR-40K-21) TaxID=446470 RepID=D3Q638_STANL|nr:MarR family winged helix-turn-helix transcriptional regulator [Stackebrandtia nassauensis]ADD42213.1 transcriptional regulator, MarR family [Stackebrandtia nassauensis DSM 44728]